MIVLYKWFLFNNKLKKLLLSAANGGTVNLKDLGIGDVNEIMD